MSVIVPTEVSSAIDARAKIRFFLAGGEKAAHCEDGGILSMSVLDRARAEREVKRLDALISKLERRAGVASLRQKMPYRNRS